MTLELTEVCRGCDFQPLAKIVDEHKEIRPNHDARRRGDRQLYFEVRCTWESKKTGYKRE